MGERKTAVFLAGANTKGPLYGSHEEREDRRILNSIAADCRDLLATLDQYTDCMDGTCIMEPCYPYIDRLEESLKHLGISIEQEDGSQRLEGRQ